MYIPSIRYILIIIQKRCERKLDNLSIDSKKKTVQLNWKICTYAVKIKLDGNKSYRYSLLDIFNNSTKKMWKEIR